MTGSVRARSFAGRDFTSAFASIILASASSTNCTCYPPKVPGSVMNGTDGTYRSYKSYKSHQSYALDSQLLPAPTTATAKTAWTSAAAAAETGRTLLVILRPVLGREVLADDEHVTFFQIAFDHFRRRAVGDAEFDPARLWLFVRSQHPDDAPLRFLNRHTCRCETITRSIGASEASSAALITTLSATSCGAGARGAISTCPASPLTAPAGATRPAAASTPPRSPLAATTRAI